MKGIISKALAMILVVSMAFGTPCYATSAFADEVEIGDVLNVEDEAIEETEEIAVTEETDKAKVDESENEESEDALKEKTEDETGESVKDTEDKVTEDAEESEDIKDNSDADELGAVSDEVALEESTDKKAETDDEKGKIAEEKKNPLSIDEEELEEDAPDNENSLEDVNIERAVNVTFKLSNENGLLSKLHKIWYRSFVGPGGLGALYYPGNHKILFDSIYEGAEQQIEFGVWTAPEDGGEAQFFPEKVHYIFNDMDVDIEDGYGLVFTYEDDPYNTKCQFTLRDTSVDGVSGWDLFCDNCEHVHSENERTEDFTVTVSVVPRAYYVDIYDYRASVGVIGEDGKVRNIGKISALTSEEEEYYFYTTVAGYEITGFELQSFKVNGALSVDSEQRTRVDASSLFEYAGRKSVVYAQHYNPETGEDEDVGESIADVYVLKASTDSIFKQLGVAGDIMIIPILEHVKIKEAGTLKIQKEKGFDVVSCNLKKISEDDDFIEYEIPIGAEKKDIKLSIKYSEAMQKSPVFEIPDGDGVYPIFEAQSLTIGTTSKDTYTTVTYKFVAGEVYNKTIIITSSDSDKIDVDVFYDSEKVDVSFKVNDKAVEGVSYLDFLDCECDEFGNPIPKAIGSTYKMCVGDWATLHVEPKVPGIKVSSIAYNGSPVAFKSDYRWQLRDYIAKIKIATEEVIIPDNISVKITGAVDDVITQAIGTDASYGLSLSPTTIKTDMLEIKNMSSEDDAISCRIASGKLYVAVTPMYDEEREDEFEILYYGKEISRFKVKAENAIKNIEPTVTLTNATDTTLEVSVKLPKTTNLNVKYLYYAIKATAKESDGEVNDKMLAVTESQIPVPVTSYEQKLSIKVAKDGVRSGEGAAQLYDIQVALLQTSEKLVESDIYVDSPIIPICEPKIAELKDVSTINPYLESKMSLTAKTTTAFQNQEVLLAVGKFSSATSCKKLKLTQITTPDGTKYDDVDSYMSREDALSVRCDDFGNVYVCPKLSAADVSECSPIGKYNLSFAPETSRSSYSGVSTVNLTVKENSHGAYINLPATKILKLSGKTGTMSVTTYEDMFVGKDTKASGVVYTIVPADATMDNDGELNSLLNGKVTIASNGKITVAKDCFAADDEDNGNKFRVKAQILDKTKKTTYAVYSDIISIVSVPEIPTKLALLNDIQYHHYLTDLEMVGEYKLLALNDNVNVMDVNGYHVVAVGENGEFLKNVTISASGKSIVLGNENVASAKQEGKTTFTVKTSDGGKKTVKFDINVAKSAGLLMLDITGTSVVPEDGKINEFTYTNSSQMIEASIVSMDAEGGLAPGGINYAVAVSGGKIVYKDEAKVLTKEYDNLGIHPTYKILPNKETVVITLTDKNNGNKKTVYTLKGKLGTITVKPTVIVQNNYTNPGSTTVRTVTNTNPKPIVATYIIPGKSYNADTMKKVRVTIDEVDRAKVKTAIQQSYDALSQYDMGTVSVSGGSFTIILDAEAGHSYDLAPYKYKLVGVILDEEGNEISKPMNLTLEIKARKVVKGTATVGAKYTIDKSKYLGALLSIKYGKGCDTLTDIQLHNAVINGKENRFTEYFEISTQVIDGAIYDTIEVKSEVNPDDIPQEDIVGYISYCGGVQGADYRGVVVNPVKTVTKITIAFR